MSRTQDVLQGSHNPSDSPRRNAPPGLPLYCAGCRQPIFLLSRVLTAVVRVVGKIHYLVAFLFLPIFRHLFILSLDSSTLHEIRVLDRRIIASPSNFS
ncbi:hypothetical protein VTN31DRAFT_140 [Thermomyces dupontii]|uniref:uncharacterized protein n=1 Tax=Talaromyces thermophilus TaxID=28565 RepID=UPI00374415AA